MNNPIDAALGIHPHALTVGARRLELLAENMANADTPHYKARDIDFRSALRSVLAEHSGGAAATLRTTHSGHVHGAARDGLGEAQFRIPNHPALDGNTVDPDLEKAAFSEAAVRYQASVDFLAGRIEGLRKALRGE